MDKVRVAIIGFGKMGVLHGALVNATGLGEVVTIVDKDEKIIKALRRLFRGRVSIVTSIDELTDVDAVFITTPIPTHYALAKSSLKLDIKGLFVEKTLTDSGAKSRELLKDAASRGIVNAVGFQKRFIPTFRYLREWVQSVDVSRIKAIRAYAYSEDFLGVNRSVGLLEPRGGVLRDLASHAIDLLFWLFGYTKAEIHNVNIEKTNDAPCGEVTVRVLISDIDTTVSTSWCKEGYRVPEVGIDIVTDDGEVIANDYEVVIKNGGNIKKVYAAELEEPVKYLLGAPEYYREVEEFLKSVVRGKGFDGATFNDAVLIDEFIDEALRVHNARTSGR
ncbi:oxidoreductase-like protein [Vulcanisaeta moutnovskia 768-28]|uniref:Oxidoreductase-like protein n=1 Tax=Vulcanisaeta moutnovskia (strain 768-28) TaxID=985053 RepID=F0QXT8_VULM7|nr:Gfo/Idh/MocA family oxidoreductase [Vulcanisaeta moutnovskia]ADY01251.1 oxidoreductase-like protein [Vulcanisaeta moutnovskia 768-28]